MHARSLFVPVLFCLLSPLFLSAQHDSSRFAQKDLLDIYRNLRSKRGHVERQRKMNQNSSKFYFSFAPPSTSNSGNGFATTFMTAFYLGEKQTTNMSTVYFAPSFNFSNRYVLPLRSYIWTKNNEFNFTGDYRFMKYPQEMYELGATSSDEPQLLLDYYQIRFYQNATAKIVNQLAIGLGVQTDYYYNIHQVEKYTDAATDWETYNDSVRTSNLSVGTTLELVYDSRKNTINPEQGWYGRVTYKNNRPEYGSSQKWNSLYLDGKKYFRLSKTKHRVIALWGLYWTVLNGKAPYLDLPSIGWDFYGHSGRGIQRNRYRSTGILYGEAEYRTDISRNGLWGAVLFVNATAPAVMNTQHYNHFYGAVGTGLRLKFDKRTGSNLLFDLGFSKNYWTWYVGLNEYF